MNISLTDLPGSGQRFIITDDNVYALYGETLASALDAKILTIPAGEASKSREQKVKLEEQLLAMGCDRNSLLIALGGGVVGDLTGFVAATFMRGINWVNIPTSLLAMVDSSIGGKTGINIPEGKNLIGAFWPSEKVLLDLGFLETLPQEHFESGFMEAVKIFITHDYEYFVSLEGQLEVFLSRDAGLLEAVIHRAIELKINVVEEDAREEGVRKVLNFGHTVGHALESMSDYKLLHGKAVAYGILVESKLAELNGDIDETVFMQIQSFLGKLGIRGTDLQSFKTSAMMQSMAFDKKKSAKDIYYVSPKHSLIALKQEDLEQALALLTA